MHPLRLSGKPNQENSLRIYWNNRRLTIAWSFFFLSRVQLESAPSLTSVSDAPVFQGRCSELPPNCASRFTERNGVKVMNLKPLTSHLVLYGTSRSPGAARIAQQSHKDSLRCLCRCDWNAEMIIWLQGAADLLLSFTSEASPRCHRDDYLS